MHVNYFFGPEEIYGVDLEGYCEATGKSVEEMIAVEEAEIELLRRNAKRIAAIPKRDLGEREIALRIAIDKAIERKRDNVLRWKKWLDLKRRVAS